jgi:SNF2 family DNA or RNA helicase
MPELLSEEEIQELEELYVELGNQKGEDDSDTDSETDSNIDDDEVDQKGNLIGFIVNDEASETESEAKEADGQIDAEDDMPGSSEQTSKAKAKPKQSKRSKPAKKGKGRKDKKDKKKKKSAMTLAELKKLAVRNKSARKRYMDRIRKDWVSSAKIEKTMEALRTIITDQPDEKVLVFSQWTSLLDLLEVPIDGEDWEYRRYDGSMNAKLRGDAVDDFRDPKQNIRIMLVSLKAGNAGLNLNAANNVIILDPFWNPYIEEQAIDRAHRLGQTKPVKVQRILVENTVEDRIIELQEKKRALIGEALDEKAGQRISRLGVRELAYLFGVTRNASDPVPYGGH